MKVVLCGVGGMGSVHFNIYKNRKDIEFAAVCDVRTDMLQEKTEGMDMKLYSDFEEMLKCEKPDVADICTPTYLHMEQSIKALESGAHVICEKPMALNAQECAAVMETVKKSGKIFMVAQVVRFMNAYIYLRNVIENKKYGNLLRLDMRRVSAIPRWSWENWMQDREKSGHVVMDLMLHDLDFVQSVLGMPKEIQGVYYDLKNMTNYASFDYLYEGFTVSAETGWYNPEVPFAAEYFALFENGFLDLKNGVLSDCGQAVNFDNQEKVGDTGINISNVDGYDGEIAYFLECVRNGIAPTVVTPESAARSVELANATIDKLTKIY